MSPDSRETQKNLKEDFKGSTRNTKVDLRWQFKFFKNCRKKELLPKEDFHGNLREHKYVPCRMILSRTKTLPAFVFF